MIENLSNTAVPVRDLAILAPFSANVRHDLVERVEANDILITIHQGNIRLLRNTGKRISPHSLLFKLIYGPSCISIETARNMHTLILTGF
jgi:hypothetical protein